MGPCSCPQTKLALGAFEIKNEAVAVGKTAPFVELKCSVNLVVITLLRMG